MINASLIINEAYTRRLIHLNTISFETVSRRRINRRRHKKIRLLNEGAFHLSIYSESRLSLRYLRYLFCLEPFGKWLIGNSFQLKINSLFIFMLSEYQVSFTLIFESVSKTKVQIMYLKNRSEKIELAFCAICYFSRNCLDYPRY